MKTSAVIISTIFMIVGMGMIAGSIIVDSMSKEFMKTAVKTEAVITNIETESYRSDGKTKYRHYTYIAYEAEGVEYENVRLGYYTSSMRVGQKIDVYYDPDNPTDVRSKDGVGFAKFMLIIMGAVFFIIPLVMLYFTFFRGKGAKKGRIRCEAEVIDVYQNTNVSVNGRHPYVVECQCINPSNGALCMYKSKNIYEDPGMYGITRVPVYVDPNKPSKYFVDVEEAINMAKSSANIMDFR